jgi:polyisoprenoid-binding protein YceI
MTSFKGVIKMVVTKEIIMKRVFLFFIVLVVILTKHQSAQKTKWANDKAHTFAKFEVQHLGISIVDGQFMEFDGMMVTDKADFTDAKINFTIQTKSVNTNVEMRDQDLRSARFFDVEHYPQMTFKSTNFESQGNDKYILTGYLTIKDVTKLVKFDVTYQTTIKDPWGNTRTGFRAELTINRFDYHISYDEKFGNNVLHVAPDVRIVVDTELLKTK